jgi:lipopolysaccharide heptosyltransferase I
LPSRFLILRTSALGDVVHCLPVLTALRRQRPRARIGWVVEEALAPLLAGHPDLDELLVVRLKPWRRRPLAPRTLAEVGRFLAAVDRFAPEVVLDLMGNHKGGLLAAVTLADERVGLDRPFRREPASAVWINRRVRPRGEHAVERALSVLAAVGLRPETPDFGGDKLFPAAAGHGGDGDGAVLIHPGAGWGNKVYPPRRWGEVARRLGGEGLAVRVAVGPGEEALAREVAAASGGAARPLAALDLPALAACLRRARLVLGGDTGPVHLAHALGTSALALLGPTDPRTNGLYGALGRSLAVELPCSYCHKRMDGPRACLLAIPPARVAARALELLAAPGPAGPGGGPEPAAAR